MSATRVILVKDESFTPAYWKVPGGGIKPSDIDIIAAAEREAFEETGIRLDRGQIHYFSEEDQITGSYRPHLCVARVSEETIDMRGKFGDEDGRPLRIAAFNRDEVCEEMELLPQHRRLVHEIEGWSPHS